MDSTLQEQLIRSIFRLKKRGLIFPPEFDINVGEWSVLKRLSETGDASEGNVCVSEIQSNLFVTKAAVSQTISSLEKKGYVTREINNNDRRRFIITLTPKAHMLINDMKSHMNDMLNEIISRFGEENTKQLIELLNRFADISEDMRNAGLPTEKKRNE